MRQLDAMRAQLIGALRTDPRVQEQISSSSEMRTAVERGSLYVTYFLTEVIHAHVERITQFTPFVWLLVELYVLVMGSSLYACASWRTLTLILDWLWCATHPHPCATLSRHTLVPCPHATPSLPSGPHC